MLPLKTSADCPFLPLPVSFLAPDRQPHFFGASFMAVVAVVLATEAVAKKDAKGITNNMNKITRMLQKQMCF